MKRYGTGHIDLALDLYGKRKGSRQELKVWETVKVSVEYEALC